MDATQKRLVLFVRLAEVCGFVSSEESGKIQQDILNDNSLSSSVASTQQTQIVSGIIHKLIQGMGLKQEAAALLWQIAKISPAPDKESTEEGQQTVVMLEDLKEILRKEILFGEELIRRKIAGVQDINLALEEVQKNQDNLSLGQVLLRRHVINSDQFIQVKKELQINSTKADSRITCNQRTGIVQLSSVNLPKSIGKYEIVREIARGGMGVVYEANDPTLKKRVALKTLLAGEMADEKDILRFHQEAQVTSRFDHPNIIPIYDVGIHENIHYFTMDYVEGPSLLEYVQKNSLPPRKVVKMMVDIADALAYAHRMGVIHRDFKPGNVLVEEKTGKPLLMDFGLARKQEGQGLTMSGVALGTPAYMPPEQAMGKLDEIDTRSDIYSFGAVLYELLSGRPPFLGASLAEILKSVMHDDPIPLRTLASEVPLDLETICMKCLSKEKKRRYPNMKMLIRDMDHFLKGDSIRAQRESLKEKCLKVIGQNKILVIASGVVILLLLLFLGFKISDAEKIEKARKQAENARDLAEKKAREAEKALELAEKKAREAEKEKKEGMKSLARAQYLKGILLYGGKRMEESIEAFTEAIKLGEELTQEEFPDLYRAYCNRGIVYCQSKMFMKSLEDFNRSISLKKDYAMSYSYRAMTYFQMGKDKESLQDHQKAIELGPSGEAYNNRAVVYRTLKEYQKALDDLTQGVRIDPGYPLVRFNRGKLYSDLGEYQKALADFQECIRLNYNQMEVLKEIQHIQNKTGKLPK